MWVKNILPLCTKEKKEEKKFNKNKTSICCVFLQLPEKYYTSFPTSIRQEMYINVQNV